MITDKINFLLFQTRYDTIIAYVTVLLRERVGGSSALLGLPWLSKAPRTGGTKVV